MLLILIAFYYYSLEWSHLQQQGTADIGIKNKLPVRLTYDFASWKSSSMYQLLYQLSCKSIDGIVVV